MLNVITNTPNIKLVEYAVVYQSLEKWVFFRMKEKITYVDRTDRTSDS